MRKFTNAPVIVVSAKTMVQTKIDLLKLGADDYMTNLICKRIIENLIVNALRYSDNYIEVSINQKGVFTIKNSTKSLDDIDVNLLFNKFYTVDKSRTKGSSGLGLYIVKELLKKIDGKIENVSYEKNILSISICFPLYNDKKLL